MNYAGLLRAGAERLHIHMEEGQVDALLQFAALLQKWNKVYSLSSIRGMKEIIIRHILDSLSVAPYLHHGRRVIDVGSGAGLPGIPLACIFQDKGFLLLDVSIKKVCFIRQTIIELGLKNVGVMQQDVKRYRPSREFDTVVSRAFARDEKLLKAVDHLLSRGRVIVMLGKQTRFRGLPKSYALAGVYKAQVPMLQASRHIAVIEKSADG